MIILEPILADPDFGIFAGWAAKTVRRAYSMVPERWRTLLPELEVVPTTRMLGDIAEIADNRGDTGECVQDLDGKLIARLSYAEGRIRLYVGGESYSGQDDELERCMLYELGCIMWERCASLRDAAKSVSNHPEVDIADEDCEAAFTEAFPDYVLNPRTLRTHEMYLFLLMERLGALVEKAEIVPEPSLALASA